MGGRAAVCCLLQTMTAMLLPHGRTLEQTRVPRRSVGALTAPRPSRAAPTVCACTTRRARTSRCPACGGRDGPGALAVEPRATAQKLLVEGAERRMRAARMAVAFRRSAPPSTTRAWLVAGAVDVDLVVDRGHPAQRDVVVATLVVPRALMVLSPSM